MTSADATGNRYLDTPTPDVGITRLTVLIILTGVLWVAAHSAGLLGSLATLTFPALTCGAVAATVVGVRRYRPQMRWPWYCLAIGFSLFLVGGITREMYSTLGDLSTSRSLVPDLVTIPGYLVVAIGLLGFVAARHAERATRVDALLDAAVAALATLTVAWLFLMHPGSSLPDTPISVRLMLAAYPPLAAFMVALTAGLVFSTGHRSCRADRFRLGAMVLLLSGDILFILLEANAITISTHLIEIPYALAYLAYISAALDPSMVRQTQPDVSAENSARSGRVVIVGFALSVPGFVVLVRPDTTWTNRVVLAAIVFSLTGTAVVRMIRALRAHARSEARLRYQSEHDALTGLPNRRHVEKLLDRRLHRLDEEPGSVALLLCDVDRFKLVNDSHGHGFGDAFLLAVADRLKSCVRPGDLVARVGGDEFLLLVPDIAGDRANLDFAQRVRRTFAEPFDVNGIEVASSISIGLVVAAGTEHGTDAEGLIRDADTAVYQAKDAGRDSVVVFDRGMRDRVFQRLTLQRDLRHALARDELSLHYQPIVDLPSGRVSGFEALLRWSHPTWGQIAPLSFIPVAEDTGQIVEIGAWVLEEACRRLAEWRVTIPHGSRLEMSVNLSARQLRDPSIVAFLENLLTDTELPRHALTLELTESTLMDNPDMAAELLTRVKQLGVSLSIDDFGTGYSSLAYLRKFPVDNVKIDRAFVSDLGADDTSDETLIAAIVAMSTTLGMQTIAEGVEDHSQADALVRLHVDRAQGFVYSRPVEAHLVPSVVARLEAEAKGRLSAVPERHTA